VVVIPNLLLPLPPKASTVTRDAPRILLVEDDPNDERFLRRALEKSGRNILLDIARDGRSALEYLSDRWVGQNPAPKTPPLLVLSDVHLPLRSGWDILDWIRRRPELARLPVFLWTSLPTPEGAERARGLGALRYLSKPRDLAGYGSIATLILSHLGD
jgi:CheY-like chemotaxis protein